MLLLLLEGHGLIPTIVEKYEGKVISWEINYEPKIRTMWQWRRGIKHKHNWDVVEDALPYYYWDK